MKWLGTLQYTHRSVSVRDIGHVVCLQVSIFITLCKITSYIRRFWQVSYLSNVPILRLTIVLFQIKITKLLVTFNNLSGNFLARCAFKRSLPSVVLYVITWQFISRNPHFLVYFNSIKIVLKTDIFDIVSKIFQY